MAVLSEPKPEQAETGEKTPTLPAETEVPAKLGSTPPRDTVCCANNSHQRKERKS